MAGTRVSAIRRLLAGLLTAVGFTIAAMLIIALLVTVAQINDKTIRTVNQFVKIAAIIIGVTAAVPRGGEKGLAYGVLIALLYIVLGYVCFLALGGGEFTFTGMLGEMLIGTAAGAVYGAVRANLNPRRKKRPKTKNVY